MTGPETPEQFQRELDGLHKRAEAAANAANDDGDFDRASAWLEVASQIDDAIGELPDD